MNGPGSKNEFAKKAKKMKIPKQMDNIDYGKESKVVIRTCDNVDSNTGKFYGTKTIITKETKLTFCDFLLAEAEDITLLPELIISEIKKNIRAGAKDLTQQWKDALELVHKAYQVTNVRRPTMTEKGAWKQYIDLLAFGVKALRDTRGPTHKARITSPIMRESEEIAEEVQELVEFNAQNIGQMGSSDPNTTHIGKRRFFVEIPGAGSAEVDAKNMDEIIEQMSNKMRRHGAKVRVEERSKHAAVITVWVDDVKRDRIVIKEIS